MADSIGQKIKKIRKAQEMNQVKFSSGLGISQGRLSEIEKDITKPSAETIIALRKRYSIDLNWLFDDE
ncbi:helix-turn-helix domain-containing protein [Paenibacillus sp. IITD108]|uniref:helix-turn-helix domain-containing protein n=1 Tax=Paenibacillus sp. IITD108 TaxID=3116649 RepID=UPI002F41B6BB